MIVVGVMIASITKIMKQNQEILAEKRNRVLPVDFVWKIRNRKSVRLVLIRMGVSSGQKKTALEQTPKKEEEVSETDYL